MRLLLALLCFACLCLGPADTPRVFIAEKGSGLPGEALAATPGSPEFQFFTITKFHADIVIREDSRFIVRETISVDFRTQRHGIYRDIPYRYRSEDGRDIETPTEMLSVTDQSGRALQYKVSRPGNIVHVRIGDPKKYVTGPQVYVITYSVDNAVLSFDDHDELYWNVTGNHWKTSIEAVSATVTLAAKGASQKNLAACYTGPLGSRKADCRTEARDSRAEFTGLTPLQPGEGLTVAFGWDKGLITGPPFFRRLLWALNPRENWVFLVPAASLLVMLHLWRTRGRDPWVRNAVVVRYAPPEAGGRPITPAEAGALLDERLDPRDITSTIVGLAVTGYIRIEEVVKDGLIFDSTDYQLVKLREPEGPVTEFERQLLGRLFSGPGDTCLVSSLKNRFYTNLDSLKSTLDNDLIRQGYFLQSPEKVRRLYMVAAAAVVIGGGFLSSLIMSNAPVKSIVSWGLAGLVVFAFSRFMPAKTGSGATARSDVLGFREFLNRAEKDRLERLNDPALFTRFLPYAIALDVVDNWSGAFEGIYQEPPDWYRSPGGFRVFSPTTFSRSISAATSSLSSALFSAPRGSGSGSGRSGFGGGGSSGGGFGGGGGGSW